MDLIMGQARRHIKNLPKDKARYYPPEAMPFILCAACLNIVLKNSEKARILYDEVIECHDLPGCREVMAKLEDEVPAGKKLIKDIVKKSGFDYNKPPERKNIGIPYMRGLLKGGKDLASKYERGISPWVLKGKGRKRDFLILIRKINELIKVGFNNRSAQEKGKYKITVNSSQSLVLAICFGALHEYCKLRLAEWEKLKVIRIGDRTYDLGDVLNDETTIRMHRYLVKSYKNAGFVLKHDQKLENIADRWYQCRVVYSGPEEYCVQMLINKGEQLDPANISNEIKECDEALGYPRGRKKKELNDEHPVNTRFSVLHRFINKIKAIFNKNAKQ